MDIQADTIIAGASMIIALCVFVVTIWQSFVMRKHNRLSVKPVLDSTEGHSHDKNQTTVEYQLSNVGVGPAIIKDFILIYGENEISHNNSTNYVAFINKQANKFMDVSWYWMSPTATLATNQKVTLLKFSYDNETKSDAEELMKNLALLVRYYSIYKNEIFVYDSRDVRQFH